MLKSFTKHFTDMSIPFFRIDTTYYLKNTRLESICLPDEKPVLFGCFLGEIHKDIFYPSFNLLDILAECSEEKIFVNQWGEIDFLYGNHMRKRHISKVNGSKKKGTYKLVQNEYDENLGYGVFTGFSQDKAQVLKHVLDRGVFIKRDKNQQ